MQDISNSTQDLLTPLMEWISHFVEAYLPLIAIFIYWCVDKKKGLYILALLVVCRACNTLLKLTACVYHPWSRDTRILPAGDAVASTTGYFFPSGHTITATAGYGSIASVFRERGAALVLLCLVLIALTGFSLNYLGVHTPQDVLTALCLGVVALFDPARLFARLEARFGPLGNPGVFRRFASCVLSAR